MNLVNFYLRTEMERVWREAPCLCPSHLIRWNRNGIGWRFSCWLSFTKGKFAQLCRRRGR